MNTTVDKLIEYVAILSYFDETTFKNRLKIDDDTYISQNYMMTVAQLVDITVQHKSILEGIKHSLNVFKDGGYGELSAVGDLAAFEKFQHVAVTGTRPPGETLLDKDYMAEIRDELNRRLQSNSNQNFSRSIVGLFIRFDKDTGKGHMSFHPSIDVYQSRRLFTDFTNHMQRLLFHAGIKCNQLLHEANLPVFVDKRIPECGGLYSFSWSSSALTEDGDVNCARLFEAILPLCHPIAVEYFKQLQPEIYSHLSEKGKERVSSLKQDVQEMVKLDEMIPRITDYALGLVQQMLNPPKSPRPIPSSLAPDVFHYYMTKQNIDPKPYSLIRLNSVLEKNEPLIEDNLYMYICRYYREYHADIFNAALTYLNKKEPGFFKRSPAELVNGNLFFRKIALTCHQNYIDNQESVAKQKVNPRNEASSASAEENEASEIQIDNQESDAKQEVNPSDEASSASAEENEASGIQGEAYTCSVKLLLTAGAFVSGITLFAMTNYIIDAVNDLHTVMIDNCENPNQSYMP